MERNSEEEAASLARDPKKEEAKYACKLQPRSSRFVLLWEDGDLASGRSRGSSAARNQGPVVGVGVGASSNPMARCGGAHSGVVRPRPSGNQRAANRARSGWVVDRWSAAEARETGRRGGGAVDDKVQAARAVGGGNKGGERVGRRRRAAAAGASG